MTIAQRLQRAGALALLAGAQAALAAGGHHAVDDADILPPGGCELESWTGRAQGGERLLHGGGACRVGPIELGAAGEYTRVGGESQTAWGLEAKWATPIGEGVSLGLAVGPAWQAGGQPRYQGTSLAGLVTWAPGDKLAVHVNLAREIAHRGEDENRWGVAVEWSPRPGWWVVAERFREEATHFVRSGLRWTPAPGWRIDASRAQRLAGPSASAWTLGLTREFGGD